MIWCIVSYSLTTVTRCEPLQRVVVLFRDAVGTLARDDVRSLDGVIARQEHLDDLVVVVLGGEDQWSHVL